MQQTNNENSTNLKIIMTFTDPPDLAIAQKAYEMVLRFTRQEGTSSLIKKLSTEDSLTRISGISKGDLVNEVS